MANFADARIGPTMPVVPSAPSWCPSYKLVRVPKSRGKYRTIYIPDNTTKQRLRGHIPRLETMLSALDSAKVNYAFLKGKNAVLNALQHIGYNYTLTLDLVDFFDTVTPGHVRGILDETLIEECFVDGAPRQGLPTSPLVALLGFMQVDKQIIIALQKLDVEFAYTRYADDLTFSFNERREVGKIKFTVQQIIQSNGFNLNHRKTRLQSVDNGRVIITGVAVDREGLYPTRKTKKRLRAALHQRNLRSARGLREWAKCKLPKELVKIDG